MIVLHLVDRLDVVDGCSKHVLLLAREQRRLGHDAAILTSGGDALDAARAEGIGVRVLPDLGHAHRSVTGFLRARKAVREVFRELAPDIAHAHHFYAATIAWFASRSMRPRLVQTVHAVIPPVGLLPHCVATRIIAVSEAVRAGLTERDPGMDARITVIRNGSAFTGDDAPLRSTPDYAALCAAREHAFVIAFAGRIVEEKGWRVLVEALASGGEWTRERGAGDTRGDENTEMPGGAREARSAILLAIAGSGTDETALRTGLRDRRVDHMMFGAVPNLRPLLEAADVLVVPSLRMEGLPMLIVEAGLAGIAVIAAHCDGIPEIIEDGVHGLLVPPGDASALAGAILRMRSDELRGSFAWALHDRVQREFSVESMAERTLEVYARHGNRSRGLNA